MGEGVGVRGLACRGRGRRLSSGVRARPPAAFPVFLFLFFSLRFLFFFVPLFVFFLFLLFSCTIDTRRARTGYSRSNGPDLLLLGVFLLILCLPLLFFFLSFFVFFFLCNHSHAWRWEMQTS